MVKKTITRQKKKTRKIKYSKEPKQTAPPVHPWRVCPYGEHWVKTHPLYIPPSKKSPGHMTRRHEHCASNPSGKDQMYPEEIQAIADQNFSKVSMKACPLNLGFKDGNLHDDLIAGWVQYWNEVLKPDVPLEPNVFKALIASESGFVPELLANKRNGNSARGLTQITNSSRKLMGGDRGGLKDNLITVTREELNHPNANICAGVRWLYEKRRLAASRLRRPVTWIEAIWEYKGLKLAKTKKEKDKIQKIFNDYYEVLQKCEK